MNMYWEKRFSSEGKIRNDQPSQTCILVQKKSTFELDGEKYKSASKHQKDWGARIISELNFSGDETILDLVAVIGFYRTTCCLCP